MKHLLTLVILFSLLSCETNEKEENTFLVEYNGALKNMMHKGDLSAKADLADFENTKNFYAIGAIENLKGEIQIFDGQSFNTEVIDSTLTYNASFDKKACLLVYSTVKKWKSITIPSIVGSYEQLEGYIEQTAKENGIDVSTPFPFLIEGTLKSFDWHVINWKDGDMEHSHEKHIHSGLYGTINNQPVEMLGFYSNAHHAIFTHHTTNMHIHVRTLDNKVAGHADDLILGAKMILKLPEVN